MKSKFSPLPLALAVAACASGLSTTAEARDRIRIPMPPPPGEVIDNVRDFIHGIGRGIRRVGDRIVDEVEIVEYRGRGRHPDAVYRYEHHGEHPHTVRPRHPISDEGVEWDGAFYPDEYDAPEMRQRFVPDEGMSPEERARWEADARREEEYLRGQGYRRELERRGDEGAPRDYPEEYDIEPTAPPPQVRRPSAPPDDFYAPTPPPSRNPGIKETGPVSVAPTPSPAPPPPPTSSIPRRTAPPAPSPAPSAPPSAPPPTSSNKPTSRSQVPYGEPVPGKKGLVYPPGIEKNEGNMVDVSDFKPGQLVRDPKTGVLFRVP